MNAVTHMDVLLVSLGVQNHSEHSNTSGDPAQTSFQVALWILTELYSALLKPSSSVTPIVVRSM